MSGERCASCGKNLNDLFKETGHWRCFYCSANWTRQPGQAMVDDYGKISMSEEKRGGPGRGQGRKPVKAGEDTVTVSVRMTTTQREKLKRLGGAKWVREQIEQAINIA